MDAGHVAEVIQTILEVDEFEAEYMPTGIVAVFPEDKELIFLHKFEIDVNALALACMGKGIPIWVVDGVRE